METLSAESRILNVTAIEPKLKHPTIFKKFDVLEPGETLTIHNDHDPKPLYYQLLGERGNIFTWEYLEEGPQLWRVNISKKLSGSSDERLEKLLQKTCARQKYLKNTASIFVAVEKKQ